MNSDAVREERENLRKLNPLRIIEYIKTSLDILIDVKVEERIDNINREGKDSVDKMNEYEPLLKKLESDIRQHIRVRNFYTYLTIRWSINSNCIQKMSNRE